jgi:hypothetical protein
MVTTFDGWQITYDTSATAAGFPWLCAKALAAAFPGTSVRVLPDMVLDALGIEPAEGADPGAIRDVQELAIATVERVGRSVV